MSGMLRRATALVITGACIFGIAASPAAAKSKTKTVSKCTPVGLLLPQLQPENNTVSRIPFSLGKLPKGAKIVDVNATLRVTTARTADLRVVLASPGGAMADLFNLRPTNADSVDLGTGPACGGTPTTLDDEATLPIGVLPKQSPYAGSYRPESSLSALDGGPAAGEFVFFAVDLNQSSGPITIDAVGLTVTYRYVPKKKKAKKTAASAKKGKFRNGTKDVCVPAAVALDNGNPPADNAGYFLKSLPIASGKLPKGAVVTDVDLRVRATHTYPGDLDFYLSTPAGGTAAAWVGYDEGLDEATKDLAFGSGPTDCTGALATFDDEATQSSTTTTVPPPFGAATFQPTSPLSVLDGKSARGNWTLWAEDKYFGDNGALRAAGLHISYRYPAPPKKK
jgi:subtilisin-like proprotein convertase family protein